MARVALFRPFDPTNGHPMWCGGRGWPTGWCWRSGPIPARRPVHGWRNGWPCQRPPAGNPGGGCEFSRITFADLVVAAAAPALAVDQLRSAADFEYEMELAGMNGAMAPQLQTVFVPSPIGARSPPHWCGDRCDGRQRLAVVPAAAAARLKAVRRQGRRWRRSTMIRLFAVLASLVCAASALAQPVQLPAGTNAQDAIVIDTNVGRVIFKLRPDLAPKHAERIKQLARDKYYDNVPFHRVIPGFMAQTGDGQNKKRHRRLEISESGGRVHADAVQAHTSAGPAPAVPPANSCSFILCRQRSSAASTVVGDRLRHGRGRQDQEGRAGDGPGPHGEGPGSAGVSGSGKMAVT